MKYAFLSDIHSNLAALNEVVKDMKGKAVKIVVLGDIVGYGPKPSEVVEWVRSNADAVIQGNHDYSVYRRYYLVKCKCSLCSTLDKKDFEQRSAQLPCFFTSEIPVEHRGKEVADSSWQS